MKGQGSTNAASGESASITVGVKEGKGSNKASKAQSRGRDENRDDWDNGSRRDGGDERDASNEQTSKRQQTKPSPSRKNKSSSSHPSPHQSPQRHFMPDGYPSYHRPPPGGGPYHPQHSMHGGPRGPPPSSAPFPPHYYGRGPPDHYRGPPPPLHYHGMPPLPHPGQPYGAPNGHYCPPPNMAGRPGPPPHSYPPPYGAPYPQGPPPSMGYHGGPPPTFHHQGNPPLHMQSLGSDSNSISSARSKGSDRRSTKSTSSNNTRKKRTIDGVHQKDKNLPSAYSFRRSNSNTSSSSTVTAGNNTSLETHPTNDDSPHKREEAPSRASSQLPPLPHQSSNIFDEERYHRRSYSEASTASSLSVGGFSLSSYEGRKANTLESILHDAAPMMKSSPKRRKGADSEPLLVDTGSDYKSSIFKRKSDRRVNSTSDRSIDGPESSRFEQLSMNDSSKRGEEAANGSSLFLSLSTSPINHPEVDATPISKNTAKSRTAGGITVKTDPMDEDSNSTRKPSPIRKPVIDRPADTPTPPIPGGIGDSEMMTDEHMLNTHLRGQSFTPLPHLSESSGVSPSNGGFSAIAPQLSWSIAGDTPSLEDLAACSWEDGEKEDKQRPSSTTSQLSTSTRGMVISPHNFMMWKEEHESNHPSKKSDDGKDGENSVRLSVMSPHSDMNMVVDVMSGTTTPLPLFFEQHLCSEERENMHDKDRGSAENHRRNKRDADSDHIHQMFVSNGGRGGHHTKHPPQYFWSKPDGNLPPTPVFAGSKPPTPLFASSNVGFARSPLHGERHHPDFYKNGGMFGHSPHGSQHHNDRVRNLRGRVPHGAHLAPMPIHIPPPMSSHHPLTSPMGIPSGKGHMWSPHHGNMPPLASPHHMSPMDMSQSKRKCVPLKPPIPSKFQGDMDKTKNASVPEFTSLVNFPAHMSQKQSVNLPEGMRCCVMCGSACPCSTGTKKKSSSSSTSSTCGKSGKSDGSLAPRSSNGQDPNSMMGDKNGYAIIPTQNKGLCTLCDVNVWVVVGTGLEIKWCKGCKNFRPWAAFGDKGLATKCLRCRERQREKYALQKEEKEKTRPPSKTAKA